MKIKTRTLFELECDNGTVIKNIIGQKVFEYGGNLFLVRNYSIEGGHLIYLTAQSLTHKEDIDFVYMIGNNKRHHFPSNSVVGKKPPEIITITIDNLNYFDKWER